MERKQTAIRLSDVEKREILERARQHGLTLSDYMRRCALGELADRSSLEERVEALEAAMRAIEDRLPYVTVDPYVEAAKQVLADVRRP